VRRFNKHSTEIRATLGLSVNAHTYALRRRLRREEIQRRSSACSQQAPPASSSALRSSTSFLVLASSFSEDRSVFSACATAARLGFTVRATAL